MKEIQLSQGKVALVDDGDYDWLNQWKWTAAFDHKGRQWSAYRKEGTYTLYMHRVVMGATADQRVNAINGDKLDCRRENLRFATYSQSRTARKKSRVGRTPHQGIQREGNKWVARIGVERAYLGLYDTAEEAAAAYDKKAVELYGEFAPLDAQPA